MAENLTRSISVCIPKYIIKYKFTRNITTNLIIYIGVLTRSISVYVPKFIIKLTAVPVVTVNTTIIYIDVFTKIITVYIPKNIINFERQSNTKPMKPLPPIIADPSMIPYFSVTLLYGGYGPILCNTRKKISLDTALMLTMRI